MSKRIIAGAMALALTAGPALAHPGHGPHVGEGLSAAAFGGFLHPLTGIDHVLAMVALGLWAGLVGGRAVVAWPLAFAVAMSAAAFYGMVGPYFHHLELAIGASIVALGLLVALRARLPLALGAAAAGLFALAHGYAHGAGIPFGVHETAYVAGFIAATLALHAAGAAAGLLLQRSTPAWAPRLSGAAVACAGLLVVLG